jgi:steroid delta-isomerase-like uncharacterized protein
MADKEANKEIVRRYLEDAWNTGDIDAIDELFAPELVEGIKQTIGMFRTAFPDWHCLIEDFIVEGDMVVNRWVGKATHNGPFFGIPATGNSVTIEGITIHEIKNGKIVRDLSEADQLGLMAQIGAMG